MTQHTFDTLLIKVRAGDGEAAACLVREYEPALRRHVRMQLTDPRLRRLVDSVDVCQSVLGNFFLRAAAGEFDLTSPRQLIRLLATMAHNRILNHFREQQADRRDIRRLHPHGHDLLTGMEDHTGTPSQKVSDAEIIHRAKQLLSPDERELLDYRASGRTWAEIADLTGETAEALRKRLNRALDRVAEALGTQRVGNE
jgi:RNA polymerase sigma-70 factor (ECF subfamily)